MRYRGLLYRALNPVYAAEPLSGEGARRFGERFDAKGVPSLHKSLSPHTALRESAQVERLRRAGIASAGDPSDTVLVN